jgi:hypothetical protein
MRRFISGVVMASLFAVASCDGGILCPGIECYNYGIDIRNQTDSTVCREGYPSSCVDPHKNGKWTGECDTKEVGVPITVTVKDMVVYTRYARCAEWFDSALTIDQGASGEFEVISSLDSR